MREYYISIYRFYIQHELSCLRLKNPTGDLMRNISWLDKLCFDTRDLGELPTAQSVGADVGVLSGCGCVFSIFGFRKVGIGEQSQGDTCAKLESKVSQKQNPFHSLKLTVRIHLPTTLNFQFWLQLVSGRVMSLMLSFLKKAPQILKTSAFC